jgi:protoporphyrinogen/coproporphyrinogen III oxidase
VIGEGLANGPSRRAGATVAVVGAGIAGLTAAHQLKRGGFRPVVFESSGGVGGRIQSFRRNDFLFDIGAFIYLGSYGDALELMREVGIGDQLGRFDAYGAMPRDGKLNFLDLNKPVRTVLGTDLISTRSKLKMLKLLVLLARHWKDLNYHDATGIAELDTDTVTSYCQRELNQEIHDYVASVVVRGPWLSDPSYTSVGQLLWTLKNFFKPYFYGLDGGMAALPRAIAAKLDVRLNTAVLDVTDEGGHVAVTYAAEKGQHTEEFDRAVIATTTDVTLSIYPQISGAARALYKSTEYISSVNTHLALSKTPANPATYIMVSPKENPDLCGCIADHRKARGRVPDGKGMLTVFCRDEWCKAHLDADDEVILEQVLRFLSPYYGDLTPTLEDYAIGRWPLVVPVMKQGRFKDIAAYERELDPSARVQLAGDLRPIGGVNAALVSGKSAAQRILTRTR